MITKEIIISIIEEYISDKEIYLVDVTISSQYEIDVIVDAITGVPIDKCIELSRFIESKFDREEQDFELTVGSQSISDVFKIDLHYIKNIGREVEIVTKSDEKIKGELKSFEDGVVTLFHQEKRSLDGKKRKVLVDLFTEVKKDDIKITKLIIKI